MPSDLWPPHPTENTPRARMLSNGRYSVLLTDAASGASSWNGYALTAWSADRTQDNDGFFMYLRDLDRGAFWSVGHQPTRQNATQYRVSYAPGQARIERLDHDIAARLEVCVPPDADVEVRRLTLENHAAGHRRIEVTTYAEVVLNYGAAHAAHPAFSRLFVETEHDAGTGALLAHRRPRSDTEHPPWMAHACVAPGALQYESDRARFVGRGRTLATPLALSSAAQLSGAAGSVLNPIFSVRRIVDLQPGAHAECIAVLAAGKTRAAVLDSLMAYTEPAAAQSAFARAGEAERAHLAHFGLTEHDAESLHELAGGMLYADPGLRADAAVLQRTCGTAAALATYGVSPGRPLIVARIDRRKDRALVSDLLTARAYWQTKAVVVDVLIHCGQPQELAAEVRALVDGAKAAAEGAVIVRQRADIPAADLDLIETCAHLVVAAAPPSDGRRASDAAASASPWGREVPAGIARPASNQGHRIAPPLPDRVDARAREIDTPPLLFDNGLGGFTTDGSEYVIRIAADTRPPMPWINVIANENVGCLVSESGAGYTWSRNSRENRLTPWSNDPISDPHDEALYIRDGDAGVFWSPFPGPAGSGAYAVHHGFGYTRWRHARLGLEHEVVVFVPRRDPVKIVRLRVSNTAEHPRRLSVVSYQRLVLGVLPGESARFVVSRVDADAHVLFASNRLNNEFSDAVVFLAPVMPTAAHASFTADRAAFLGRNGDTSAPAALQQDGPLDGTTGAALDACACAQIALELGPGDSAECVFLLGETTDEASARALVASYRRPGAVDAALQAVRDFWGATCAAVQVQTPSPAIDLMLNGWLLYQTLSCRLWARSAFYQSGGAFGFRDQLQDSAALLLTRPDLTRAQIVLHATHQFIEGDVLHWWHPPTSRGIRTRFSDDLVWLPYIVATYIHTTGDWSVLDETAGFVQTRQLAPEEDEAYLFPERAAQTDDIYGHCCRALDRSLTRGTHGLPLMGTGDWNDGMNRVGREGRGESVWMGFFLSRVIDAFVPICQRRGDTARVARYRGYRTHLETALNDAGWDGEWYRRAYYDDGSPLGSRDNVECRIDALAQAWAVLSSVAPPERAAQAMDAVERLLVAEDAGIIRLLTPPFDHDSHDPGYIKGYVPGIRENGGQYTHAAVWTVQALAALGRRERAAALLERIGPVWHARSPEAVAGYQLEPYVVAADIYGVEPHVGRGGWSWYTGSAGWMYRVALESILGVRLVNGDTLWVKPCIPDEWPQFWIGVCVGADRTRLEILVDNPSGLATTVLAVIIDGHPGVATDEGACIPLSRDGATHHVRITLGPSPS